MKVKCDVWRSDPGAAAQGSYSTYVLDVDPTETVLGILVVWSSAVSVQWK
jgi:succinate dehydrogenase/fumarate reductase-like Fe-S protein